MGLKPVNATSFELTALIVSGIPFYGLSIAFISIPAMPEIIEGVSKSEYSGTYNMNILYNNLSGYFIICQAIGEMTGPLLASLGESKVGFRESQLAEIGVIFTFIFTYLLSLNYKEPLQFFKIKE